MIKAIDFFCGGGGMTYGLKKAGINVLAGIDIDPICRETYEHNNSPAAFIQEDIEKLLPEQLENGYKIGDDREVKISRNDDNLLFAGCSPCQFWSLMSTDKTRSESSRNLLEDFRKFVEYFNPGYVLIENVPGIYHRQDSPLKTFISFLRENNYNSVDHDIVSVFRYGVPQTRRRFILVASRVRHVELPPPDKSDFPDVRSTIGDKSIFPEISDGHRDTSEFCHTTSGLTDINRERLRRTPADGGTREAWADTEYQLDVYKRHQDNKRFGFQDVYGRMYWDRPAPTITTRFYSISNGRFAHPEQNRPISLREGAALQTFPNDFVFKAEAIADVGKLIGNAVPPELARRIGTKIVEAATSERALAATRSLFDNLQEK